MKVSVDWIGDFVDLPPHLDDSELAERVTLSICEVDGFKRTMAGLEKITVAQIIGIQAHPKSEKLTLVTVNIGEGQEAVVVCGASNSRSGLKVPYASLGTTLPNGIKLGSKKIRGVLSEGMLCSEDELGFSDEHSGLMELDASAEIGASITRILEDRVTNDLLLDIDNKSLTHRPDCWGHYGLAREFAAVFNVPFHDRFNATWVSQIQERIASNGGTAPIAIHVDRDSANRGFLGLSVDGVSVGTSPDWMQRRLISAGMRPINTIVDISNYVMLETGIPNHIFDRSTIHGAQIFVRRAEKEMDFTTLDGHVRRIIPGDTMVCDARGESAIAGIMGGLASSVMTDTTQVMIEVANWTDAEIRRTGTRLGLRTDASQRYEKSLDSQQLEKCLLRIFELLLELCPDARAVGGIQSDNMPEPVNLIIETSPLRIARVLGRKITEQELGKILESLGFSVENIPGVMGDGEPTHRIHVPSWRSTKDIECEADIVEEIGRVIGYSRITPISPHSVIKPLRLSPAKLLFRKIQDYLVLRGQALEVMTYPLVGPALLEKAAWPTLNTHLVLANALTPEHDRMRPSMIPSLLQASGNNCKVHSDFRIFECGRSYEHREGAEFSRDLYQVGIVFQAEKETPFIDLADCIENLLTYAGVSGTLVNKDFQENHPLLPASWAGSHPHECLDVKIANQSRGIIVSIHPQISRVFRMKGHTAVAVLDFTELVVTENVVAFQPLDRFPRSEFDVTVVMLKNDHVADVVNTVNHLKIENVRSVGILDMFPLNEKNKAVTLRIQFRDAERTIDAATLKVAEECVMAGLEAAGYPLRGE